MTSTTLKGRFIADIRKNEALKLQIAEANDVKMVTVDRWLKGGNEYLTTFRNLEILKRHFGVLEVHELLETNFLEGAIAGAS
jgi:hypothetical protein